MNEENRPQGNSDWLKTFNLALTDVVSCDTVGCERPAQFWAKVNCCGAVTLGCVPCMQNTYNVIKQLRDEGRYIQCRACGNANKPTGWISKPEKL